MKARLLVAMLALSGPAWANDLTYDKDVAPNEHLSGTIEIDDSSGDVNSVTGEATGAVKGAYRLDPVNIQAEIADPAGKLVINFNRRDQAVTAHLDICASPDTCTPSDPVTVWEKP